ncbi:protein TIFY 5A [Alnus glutinosa]|uniref:protein TIFY 5A n=1 Tax=Alnus glutinosa TaxID=3517 RepID=UPI002D76F0CE|nr:protein TIFY 5A [Alnus glutinosa]
MRRNCNLELRLFPYSDSDLHPDMEERCGSSSEEKHQEQQQLQQQQQQQQQQQLTIFYNGKICVSDVTELRARSILLLATREAEERMRTPTGSEPCSPAVKSPAYSPTAGLYMKRSLQCFLQKRKHRIQATSPYNH